MAREIRRRNGIIPVVLMTGYCEVEESAATEGFPLLRKPFTFSYLVEHLPDPRMD